VDGQAFILQKINEQVFRQPESIAENLENMAVYLKHHHPDYLFVTPIKTIAGEAMLQLREEGCFRMFPFVKNATTYNVVATPQQAFEAANQFGLFTKKLNAFPVHQLKITLPDFHNLTLRHHQFKDACKHGNESRINESAAAIHFLGSHNYLVETYKEIIASNHFTLRVTHHDTKISNVLFNQNDQALCVIDLDTVMPGYFISDVGDMMRTYLSPASEEQKNFSQIEIREEFFRAIVEGYLKEMRSELSDAEIRHFVYSGLYLIYMQALRFLTDHLNNDIYYGAAYPGQNLLRAQNQITLLQKLLQHQRWLNEIVLETAGW
jgi:Ser/Thr protein kinase RdoA (MazF antagonist)